MKRLTPPRAPRAAIRNAPVIAFSITNQGGAHYHCDVKGVTLEVEGGTVQIFPGRRGCFVAFERCRVELRDGRRSISYQLLEGAASSRGHDLTIIGEFEGEIPGVAMRRLPQDRSQRKPTSRTPAKRNQPGTAVREIA